MAPTSPAQRVRIKPYSVGRICKCNLPASRRCVKTRRRWGHIQGRSRYPLLLRSALTSALSVDREGSKNQSACFFGAEAPLGAPVPVGGSSALAPSTPVTATASSPDPRRPVADEARGDRRPPDWVLKALRSARRAGSDAPRLGSDPLDWEAAPLGFIAGASSASSASSVSSARPASSSSLVMAWAVAWPSFPGPAGV